MQETERKQRMHRIKQSTRFVVKAQDQLLVPLHVFNPDTHFADPCFSQVESLMQLAIKFLSINYAKS